MVEPKEPVPPVIVMTDPFNLTDDKCLAHLEFPPFYTDLEKPDLTKVIKAFPQ